MKILSNRLMQNLAFSPDFDVETFEFLPEEKKLKIAIEGAWLEEDQLGRGSLYFHAWENLSIRKYDSAADKWSSLHGSAIEPLEDLCEVVFADTTVCLSGFGTKSGQWVEWTIQNAQMHAEFDELLE